MATSRSLRSGLVRGLAVLALVMVVVVAGLAATGALSREGGGLELPTFEVRQGPLTISVTESGAITARDQTIIKSEVEGQTTIIYLVDEGTQVQPGDLLVELDASRLQDDLVEQQIKVQNSEASFIRARENLAVAENQARSDRSRAELDLQFAREDLEQYQQGEYPRALMEAESSITLARERLEQAEETLRWSEQLSGEKYISQAEYEKDRLALEGARLDHELALADKELLVDFTRKRRITELESAIEQAELALERVNRKATADVVQAEAELKAREAEFEQQQQKLAKLEDQIEKTRIYSPVAGMVVYATSSRGNWRGNAEPLDEGQTVGERKELIHLPTSDSMTAEIKVHESNLEKVQPGQPVRLTVEALPGRVFTGLVTRIAPLPDAQSVWLNPDLKVYSTLIDLTGDTSGLRTGMSCNAEILVERHDRALQVPVQAIVRVDGQPCAFVVAGGDPERRPVEIGLDNNRMVHILSGLTAGEQVLLTPPLAAGGVTPETEEDFPAPAGEEPPDAPPPGGGERPGGSRPPSRTQAQPPDAEGTGAAGTDDEPSRGGRDRFRQMTPEQREEMRRRFEQMTPEEREAMRQRRRGGRGGRDREEDGEPR